MTIYNLPRPLRVGFACNADTFARMADEEAIEALSSLGRFEHHLCDEPSWGDAAPP